HYILLGLSFKTRALWKLSCLLKAAPQSLACIRLGLQGQSFLHALSTGCGPDVCAIRTSYWPLPYLLRRLLTLTLPPEETVGLYLTSRGDCWPLPYLVRRLLALTLLPEETAGPYFIS
ncbi:hypothetical protein Tco_1549898, partial [Tanacetum coccineum]